MTWQVPLNSTSDELYLNTLRPRQNGRHFPDDILRWILNENASILLKISLKFVPRVRINNIPALVQIMAGRRPGNKPLSEPMMVSLLTYICVTWPQWVNIGRAFVFCEISFSNINEIECKHFHSRTAILKSLLERGNHFVWIAML